MSEQEIVAEFEDLWSQKIGDYALIRSADSLGYSIMNVVYNTMLIIEVNEEACAYIIKKMIENGVRIAANADEVRNPNPPDPIFCTPELEKQYRKIMQERHDAKARDIEKKL